MVTSAVRTVPLPWKDLPQLHTDHINVVNELGRLRGALPKVDMPSRPPRSLIHALFDTLQQLCIGSSEQIRKTEKGYFLVSATYGGGDLDDATRGQDYHPMEDRDGSG